MRITAIDPSLNSTGYATADGVGRLRPPSGQDRGTARLRWVRDAVVELVADADLVLIEGFSFGSEGRALFDLGGLGWLLRVAFDEVGAPWLEVAPSRLKKFATGRGNAGKDLVLVEAVKRLRYSGSSNDEADALWLRQMALTWYELPGAVQLPAANRSVLADLDWPLPKIPATTELAL